jgi:hypothetical protein
MSGFDFAVCFLLFPGPFHGPQLILGEDEVFLSGFGFQSFEPFTKGFQIVAQPDAPHPGGRDKQAALGQFVGHTYLAEGRLLQSDLDHRFFDVLFDPVLGAGFASADLVQRQLATLLVQLFEAIKAISRVAHHLAGLRDTTQHCAELQQPHFVLDDFFFGTHLTFSFRACRASLANVRSS